MANKQTPDQFLVEATPVVEIKRHAPTGAGSFENEKTEVYLEEEGGGGGAYLIDADGDFHTITTFPYVIGRGTECDLVLTGKGISRKHAEIVFQSGRFVVNDLESLNGLKVNGYKVARVILEENDAIRLGEVTLTFSTSREAAPAATPVAQSAPKSRPSSADDGESLEDLASSGLITGRGDPFAAAAPKPSRKLLPVAIIGGAVVMAGVAGLLFVKGKGPSTATLVSAPMPSVSTEPAPPADAPEQAAAPAPDMSPAPGKEPAFEMPSNRVSGTEPPPSIGLASPSGPLPPPVAEKPGAAPMPPPVAMAPKAAPAPKPVPPPPVRQAPVAVAQPAPTPKPAPVAAPKPAAPALSMGAVDERYLSGQADAVIAELQRQASGNSPSARAAAAKRDQLLKAYNLYLTGKQSMAQGDKARALESWSLFLEAEKGMYGNRRSVFGAQVAGRIMDEYVQLGNVAAKGNRHHDAYKAWQKALSYGDSVAARIGIDNANNNSRKLYRQALRLEYVNTERAKELWQQVIELVPPGSEYYGKASEKLAWYNKWGA